ncbi:HU family DNA-binding protein [Vibrio fluvialis]|uniref:HU family DNA-binding protein n=1 Tax=Vibrio fluvialis TaxID=676 RepID=UPI001EEAB0C2|nr:HU family DNA-binding protein [Vibrio fluvialis]MCG6387574.1 HU family DNA-binding protein [Vibrio fluvialis]MCG6418799.1 HU family DNA-binding protein [Vibrio fluvialis]
MIGKSDVAMAMADKSGLPRALCRKVLDAYLDEIIKETLTNDNEVVITGVGRFSVVQKNARMGRNVRTQEPALIAPRKILQFKAFTPFRKRMMEMMK